MTVTCYTGTVGLNASPALDDRTWHNFICICICTSVYESAYSCNSFSFIFSNTTHGYSECLQCKRQTHLNIINHDKSREKTRLAENDTARIYSHHLYSFYTCCTLTHLQTHTRAPLRQRWQVRLILFIKASEPRCLNAICLEFISPALMLKVRPALSVSQV